MATKFEQEEAFGSFEGRELDEFREARLEEEKEDSKRRRQARTAEDEARNNVIEHECAFLRRFCKSYV